MLAHCWYDKVPAGRTLLATHSAEARDLSSVADLDIRERLASCRSGLDSQRDLSSKQEPINIFEGSDALSEAQLSSS